MNLLGGTGVCQKCGRWYKVVKPKDADYLYCYHDPNIPQEPCSEGGKRFRVEIEMKEICDSGKEVPHV